ARYAIELGKISAQKDFAIRLHSNRPHRVVRAASRIKAQIEIAVAVEPRDARAIGPVHRAKGSTHQHFTISLRSDGIDTAADAGARIEAGINRAVWLQPADAVEADVVHRRKIAAKDNFQIRLQGHGEHAIIGAKPRVKFVL